MKLKCPKHPKYQVKKVPRANCDYCKYLWYAKTRDSQWLGAIEDYRGILKWALPCMQAQSDKLLGKNK